MLEEVMRTTKMQDVFRRYAATKGFTPADSLTFRRNNKRIHGNKTVADLGLEENDLIDCVLRRAAININLRFRAYNREEITINVRRKDKLRYALREYVIIIGRSEFVRRFEFIKDKSRFEVHPDSTPERLQMTDNDLIYCYVGPQNDDFANEENESITLRLKDACGEETMVFLSSRTKHNMGEIFETYSRRTGYRMQDLRFMLNGEEIQMDPNVTPAYFNLRNNDQIDCFLQLRGC